MKNQLFGVGVFLIICCLFACTKFDKIKIVDNDAEFAIPLINTELTINNILDQFDKNTFITIDSSNLITLNYKGDFLEVNAESVFNIFGQFGAFPLIDTFTIAPLNPPNSIRIDLVSFKSGSLLFTYKSFHEEDMEVKFRLPDLRDPATGEVFEKTVNANYTGTTPVISTELFSIDGLELESDNNELIIVYEATHLDGTRDTLSEVFMGISNFAFDYVEGFLGTDVYEMDRDTIEIDVFDNWIAGDVFFEDPSVRLTANNAFGFPVNSQTNFFNVFTVAGQVLPLESEFVDDGIFIDYPRLDEIGEVKTTVFDFNKNNSNIDVILGSGPRAIDYEFDAIPNPESNTDIIGFMDCNSFFNVQVEVALPLHAQIENFTLFDTILIEPIEFDATFLWYENLDQVEFKVKTINSTALDIPLQVYFTDENGVAIDSLIPDANNIINAASVDMNGEVIAPQESEQLITFEFDQIEQIKTATQIVLKTKFSTYNDGEVPIKILSGEGIQIKVGAKVGFGD